MSEEEIKKVIDRAVRDSVVSAVRAELGAYKIPREEHYLDHVWLSDWRRWQASVKSSVLKSIIGIAITALSVLVFYGFLFIGGGKH
ncbi:hypothetical protein MNBD_DELTA02-719 [hydrothermal vent metagenome]|uniref:Uncharacterized protein n=1 Tax=hydrothermal vent metagenome TaxID=652676 RepID=A0A3B0W2I3_9ZZZZ